MVIAHHLIWTLYGWWLPNDPRGSSSDFVHSDVIFELGTLHEGRKRVQPSSREIREFYDRAKTKLKFELLKLELVQFPIVAEAFANAIHERGYTCYTCYACAIMPDHIHVIIRKHKDRAEDMIGYLQEASRTRMIESGIRTDDHPCWGGPGWKVFLDAPVDIWRTIKYVNENPLKLRLPRQSWSFIKRYDNWDGRRR